MGGNTIWSYLTQFGAERIAGIVIVDQTPKMLNTADWTHGYYGYDESNVDTYFAETIPPAGHGTPVWKRGRRLLRLFKAMKGVDRDISRAALAPIGSSIIIPNDGHAANIEQPDAFNEVMLDFARSL